ncbi:hypothetical protein H632_c4761p0, partial [Helicosporidium sp. ATCC 50920]
HGARGLGGREDHQAARLGEGLRGSHRGAAPRGAGRGQDLGAVERAQRAGVPGRARAHRPECLRGLRRRLGPASHRRRGVHCAHALWPAALPRHHAAPADQRHRQRARRAAPHPRLHARPRGPRPPRRGRRAGAIRPGFLRARRGPRLGGRGRAGGTGQGGGAREFRPSPSSGALGREPVRPKRPPGDDRGCRGVGQVHPLGGAPRRAGSPARQRALARISGLHAARSLDPERHGPRKRHAGRARS